MASTISNRYSEADLEEFKALIEKKIAKATLQLEALQTQLEEAADSKGSEGDWMDDSSSSTDMDMLYTMTHRQKKHLLDLNNALQRVHNKSYGICIITRELIDKRRLLAVPTTTKSMAAKVTISDSTSSTSATPKKKTTPKSKPSQPKIITRIIKKPTTSTPAPVLDNDFLEEEEDMDDLSYVAEDINLDEYSEEDLD